MRRSKVSITISAAFLISLSASPSASAQALSPENPAAPVEDLIDHASMAAAIRFLSHDLLEGRGVGSRGDELARLYIRTQFEMFGLQPAAGEGRWDQRVPIVGITATVDGAFRVRGTNGEELTLTPPDDYTAEAGRAEESVRWQDAEIVFVGYGITAPEQRWDDYKGADLRGKVLLVMNNDPADDPALFAGKTRLYYGRWSYKYEEAARRGAVGAIVIHTTPSAGYPFQVIQATHGKEHFWLPFDESEPQLQIRSWCSEDAARRICKLGGHDLDSLRATAETRDFTPVPLGVTAALTLTNRVTQVNSGNVLGMLPGSDPELTEQVVVVTAHFDHLGIGAAKRGDPIYNGALDNASGSATLLSLARACAALPQAPRRSILFAAVTAEESGLLGSLYYAQNPTVPKKRLIANFNVDGINIWGATRDIAMIGHGKNSLTALAEKVAERRGRVLEPDQQTDLGLFYRSDHFSFARIGVPAAYFKAGHDFFENSEGRNRVKNAYTTVHYHQPSDEFDERWNLDGAVADTRLILECLLQCANSDTVPTWTPGDEFEKLR